jgi:peptide/nickel transport system substrate-binding protein
LLLAIGALFLHSACTAKLPAASQDGTLRVGARGTNDAPGVIRSFLFAEGLFALDWQGRPTARLATTFEWADAGLTLHVPIRHGVRFHDETPVTAEAVRRILQQIIDKKETTGFEAVKKLEVGPNDSLVFHLNRPDGFLPGALATTLIVDKDKPDIGTGPYRLVPGMPQLEAVRNISYYRGNPGLDRIRVIPYLSPRASWVGLLKGEVDMALEINRESAEFVEGATRFAVYSSTQPFYIPLVFNLRNPILARPEVRRAIADAIDRNEIVSQGMRLRGQPAEDPVWPYHWAYNSGARDQVPSPNASRVRLDAAGLPVLPAAPGRRASRFQLSCIIYNGEPQFERIGLLLQRQLAAIGIDLVLEGLPYKEVVARLGKGQFDTYLFQLTSGRDVSWVYRFWHSPNGALGTVLQNTGYTGADAVLDRLRQARDEPQIRSAVGDLRQRFYEDVPAVFLAWTKTTRAVDTRFDIGDPSDPEIFANLWRWHLASTQLASR